MGRLGGTGGGIEQEALARAQSAADLQRQMMSQDWAQSRAMNRFNTAQQAVQAGQAQAANQFNMGTGSMGQLGQMFQMLLNQGNFGAGLGVGAPAQLAAMANQSPINTAVLPALQSSGVFDKLGGWLGGKIGGSIPEGMDTAMNSTLSPGPYAGGYRGGTFPTPQYQYQLPPSQRTW